MNERVSYNYRTGTPSRVVSSVLRSVSAYTRRDRASSFKIGITSNPEDRFRRGYANDYDKMVVVYQTSSIKNVRKLETLLIEHKYELCDNINAGGGGNYGEAPYYMYVAINQ